MTPLLLKLAKEDLVDVVLISKCTLQVMTETLGLSVGCGLQLQYVAHQATLHDNLFSLGDVIDRICLVIFPIVWLISIEVILGDHLDIGDIMFGLVDS
ncbi:hypothetical protein CYMTET_4247 [Cymbomonas tetramitiformis]|uniref:Uncharacterized protein n=1 Tax=Cymbomonas tetramitiformis TaxID=36881 RepID=A0AAE0LKK8_9CHLO|nr:hypothetical protein CYMTET_4247 [Cymbomonas tetramitiformis]